jgi:hypothetical protein
MSRVKLLRAMSWLGRIDVKVLVLMYRDLAHDECKRVVELPMGYINRCRKYFTYYKIVNKTWRPTEDTAEIFEVAYAENLLPAVYMYAGFKVILSGSGLYLYSRNMASYVISMDIGDLIKEVSAGIEHYVAQCNKEKYKEEKRRELRKKYEYVIQ